MFLGGDGGVGQLAHDSLSRCATPSRDTTHVIYVVQTAPWNNIRGHAC